MFGFWRRRPRVLVVGTAHLDILSYYSSSYEPAIDRMGTVEISVGGTGLNLALQLSTDASVTFTSAFRKQSAVYAVVAQVLRMNRVNQSRVVLIDADTDGGFSAHYRDREFVAAVTETLVDRLDLTKAIDVALIRRQDCVVADCNLTGGQLRILSRICSEADRPLLLSGVSELKAMRVRELAADRRGQPVLLFSFNDKEASHFLARTVTIDDPHLARELLAAVPAEIVVVTFAVEGYRVLRRTGEELRFLAPTNVIVESSAGAGDALLSAIALQVARDGAYRPDEADMKISEYVARTLRSKTPNFLHDHADYRRRLERLHLWNFSRGRPGFVGAAIGLYAILRLLTDLTALATDLGGRWGGGCFGLATCSGRCCRG